METESDPTIEYSKHLVTHKNLNQNITLRIHLYG